ncbi:MAG: DUF924 family protein [Thermodesulfobacteriota bacterium]
MRSQYEKGREERILQYWFGKLREGEAPSSDYYKKWFAKRIEIDQYIKTTFEDDLELAVGGKLKSWENTPRGTLALIILLDQFSRNIYRGTLKAFAQDLLALEICLRGIDKGFDAMFHPVERLFFYMPLEHSEDLEIQKKSVEYFSMLEKLFLSPPSLASMLSEFKNYADKHFVIIERFGRFPHRNEILGRKSTPEEIEFLKQPGSSF